MRPQARQRRSSQSHVSALPDAARARCRALSRVLGGLSCREYEAAAEAVPEAFGLARSSVSRRFIRARARALRQVQERRLDDARWLVVLLDGKTFASDSIVIALGVTLTGEKRLLGLVQTATENRRVCAAFLRYNGSRQADPQWGVSTLVQPADCNRRIERRDTYRIRRLGCGHLPVQVRHFFRNQRR